MRRRADHRRELGLDERLVDRLGGLADPVVDLRGLECLQGFQQCRLVKGHRALCPFTRTIGVGLADHRTVAASTWSPTPSRPMTYTTRWDATETAEGHQRPMLNVFHRDGRTIRHFWGSELFYAPTDPGQDPRHVGTIEPLWNLFDLTPEGRPTGWDEQLPTREAPCLCSDLSAKGVPRYCTRRTQPGLEGFSASSSGLGPARERATSRLCPPAWSGSERRQVAAAIRSARVPKNCSRRVTGSGSPGCSSGLKGGQRRAVLIVGRTHTPWQSTPVTKPAGVSPS